MSTLISNPLNTVKKLSNFTLPGFSTNTLLTGGKNLSDIAGASNNAIPYSPLSFTSPGFSATKTGDVIDLTQGPAITSALNNLAGTTDLTNTKIGDLLTQLGPSYDALTKTALANLESSRRATIGNLRENLARRRIAGSSFASDALSRANAEFDKQAATITSTNKLASIDAANKLIQQQHDNALQNITTSLNQLNLEGTTAAQVASGVSGIMANNAQLQAQLNAQAQQGTGALFGNLANTGLNFALLSSLMSTAGPASSAFAVL